MESGTGKLNKDTRRTVLRVEEEGDRKFGFSVLTLQSLSMMLFVQGRSN